MFQFLAETPAAGMSYDYILMMLLIMVAMFGFTWLSGRKQRKQQKVMNERRKNLRNGDRVMMTSGIFGVVSEVSEDVVTINVGPQKVPLVFSRSAVSVVEYDDDATDLSKEEAKKLENNGKK